MTTARKMMMMSCPRTWENSPPMKKVLHCTPKIRRMPKVCSSYSISFLLLSPMLRMRWHVLRTLSLLSWIYLFTISLYFASSLHISLSISLFLSLLLYLLLSLFLYLCLFLYVSLSLSLCLSLSLLLTLPPSLYTLTFLFYFFPSSQVCQPLRVFQSLTRRQILCGRWWKLIGLWFNCILRTHFGNRSTYDLKDREKRKRKKDEEELKEEK